MLWVPGKVIWSGGYHSENLVGDDCFLYILQGSWYLAVQEIIPGTRNQLSPAKSYHELHLIQVFIFSYLSETCILIGTILNLLAVWFELGPIRVIPEMLKMLRTLLQFLTRDISIDSGGNVLARN